MECGPQVRDEDTVFLGQVIHRQGQVLTYEYDFGDGWRHEAKVENSSRTIRTRFWRCAWPGRGCVRRRIAAVFLATQMSSACWHTRRPA